MALIKTGWAYKFKFNNLFSVHDGVYTIVKIYSWDELFKDNVSLYDLLYAPLKITRDQFNEDVLLIRTQDVYKLVSPVDHTKELFIPESILAEVPLYPVKQYGNLVFYIPLGVYEENNGLDYLHTQIKEQLTGALGITYDPKLVATGYTYLTEPEYKEVCAERDAQTKKILNFFTENIKLQDELSRIKTQNESYQKIIKDLIGGS